MREDLDVISNELFRKLEKILEDAETSSESKSSIANKSKQENVEKRPNQLKYVLKLDYFIKNVCRKQS